MDKDYSVLLTTESPLKFSVLSKVDRFEHCLIDTIDCAGANLPEQPYGALVGYYCAQERIKYAISQEPDYKTYDYIISIENSIDIDNKDKCYVVIHHNGCVGRSVSFGVQVPTPEITELHSQELVQHSSGCAGYNSTAGQLIAKNRPGTDHKNWHTLFGSSRTTQIEQAISNALAVVDCMLELRLEFMDSNSFDEIILNHQNSFAEYIYCTFSCHTIDFVVCRHGALSDLIVDRFLRNSIVVRGSRTIPVEVQHYYPNNNRILIIVQSYNELEELISDFCKTDGDFNKSAGTFRAKLSAELRDPAHTALFVLHES